MGGRNSEKPAYRRNCTLKLVGISGAGKSVPDAEGESTERFRNNRIMAVNIFPRKSSKLQVYISRTANRHR